MIRLAPKPNAGSRRGTTGTTSSLIGAGLGNFLDRESVDSAAGVEVCDTG